MNIKNQWSLLRNPIHCISLGGGLGLSPWAPGTLGTLPGFLIVAVLQLCRQWWGGSWWGGLGLLVLMWGGALWCAERTARAMGVQDPGAIVCDEYLAFAGLLWFLPEVVSFSGMGALWPPQAWATAVWAFLLFRLFDITKPFPISWADQRLQGGLGIMVDDVLAGVWAYAMIRVLQAIPLPGGP
jgi:phosphatidylglycerophosphatase A